MANIRNLVIDIYKDKKSGEIVDFEIKDNNLYNEKKYKNLEIFAHCWIYNNKIGYIFDICVLNEYLQKAQKEPLFNEICEFAVTQNGEEKETFQGSFIDALKYIKEMLR